jgi:hypothetical protein
MSGIQHRKRGAPLGNQNAWKHGYYSRRLTPHQQDLLSSLARLDTRGREIDIMRIRIASILAGDPGNKRVLTRALVSLAGLLRANRQIGSLEVVARSTVGAIAPDLTSRNNRAWKYTLRAWLSRKKSIFT